MSIEADLRRVVGKLHRLPTSAGGDHFHEPVSWAPPLDEPAVAAYEREHGVALPPDYRAFITRVARGGTRPFYGLWSLVDPNPEYGFDRLRPGVPFPFTVSHPLFSLTLGQDAFDEAIDGGECDRGFVPLCTEGCGMNTILVVNAADPRLNGTVWYYDLANDAGILPLLHPRDGKPFSFLSWFEHWLDGELSGEPVCFQDLIYPGDDYSPDA